MQSSLSPTLDGATTTPTQPEVVQRRARSGVLVLAGMYAVAATVYAVLASRIPMPLITPDEFTYGHLASSIAHGEGFNWRGAPVPLRAALYIFFITPSWLVASGTTAYLLAKITGALLVSTVAIPIWLVTRELAGRRLATVCAGITLLGLWMTTPGFLLTENLALPLGVAAVAALVMSLREPGTRWGWIAFGFAALATWARLQLVALFAVIALALAIEIVRSGRAWRVTVRQHRGQLMALGALLVAGLLALAFAHDLVLGTYSGITAQRPSFSHALSYIGRTGLGLVSLTAFVPAAIFVALLGSRGGWRDPAVGPLLTVVSASVAVLVTQSGWFTAGQPLTWYIERYVAYAAPLMLVLAIVAVQRQLVSRVWVALAVVAFAGLDLTLPSVRSALEERSYFVTTLHINQVLGTGDRVSLAMASLAVGASAILILSRIRPDARAIAVGALLGAIFAVQTEASWNWQIDVTRGVRWGFPSDLAWLQHDVRGDVAEILTGQNTPESAIVSFFNPNVTRMYRSPKGLVGIGLIGGNCPWSVNDQGAVFFDPKCGPPPRQIFLDTPGIRMTFRGQKVLADHGPLARVVAVPAGQPQLSGYITYSCGRIGPVLGYALGTVGRVKVARCTGTLSGFVFPRTAATLRITYHGGARDHYVAVAGKPHLIPAGRDASITMQVRPGPQRFEVSEDWTSSSGSPTIVRGDLVEQGGSQQVL